MTTTTYQTGGYREPPQARISQALRLSTQSAVAVQQQRNARYTRPTADQETDRQTQTYGGLTLGDARSAGDAANTAHSQLPQAP